MKSRSVTIAYSKHPQYSILIKIYQFLGHVQSSETFNGTLLILSAVKSDSGNYKCVAATTLHYAISAPALVKVIGKIID